MLLFVCLFTIFALVIDLRVMYKAQNYDMKFKDKISLPKSIFICTYVNHMHKYINFKYLNSKQAQSEIQYWASCSK